MSHRLLILTATLMLAANALPEASAAESALKLTPRPYLGPPATKGFETLATEPFAKLGNFDVDVDNRQHVQSFFNSIYTASEGTPMGFTGDVASCSPGDTDPLFKDAVVLRINWFREVAGVPDVITFRDSYSASAQDAALIMAANSTLTHFPSPSLDCYTSSGDLGAQSSNLAIGNMGWDAVDGYMDDNGANNTAVGHRRWLLHPPVQEMGTGDIPPDDGTFATNAIWVFDDNIFANVTPRDGFVAWPPPGNVPYSVVPSRWSFGLDDAGFGGATVAMSSGGNDVPVVLEPVSQGSGINTLVWIPMGLDPDANETWPKPGADAVYTITVSDVLVGGAFETFRYDVNIFDPTTAGPADVVQNVTGPTAANTGTAERYAFETVPFAEANAFRAGTLVPFTAVEGAETGGADVTDNTEDSYPLITTAVAAIGSASFHLAHPQPETQSFVWEKQVLLSAASTLEFRSRLGWATTNQVAKAQISSDDGQTWADVYSQVGDDGSGESGFTARSVPLAGHADKVVKIRFAYEHTGGSFFSDTNPGIGFYVDEVTVTNAEELTNIEEQALGKAGEFSYLPETTGRHLLQTQFVPWQGFAGSAWGPPLEVDVDAAPPASTAVAASVLPASRSVYQATATAFATIINGGSVAATGCRIVPAVNTLTSFFYQTTDPATNALTGTPNTPADIPAGEFQTFAIFFTPTAAFGPVEVQLSFDCANSAPAPVVSGLTTLLLSSGAAPIPDIIALATGTGVVDIPGATGTGVFAVATLNAGAGGDITASASAPPALGVSINLCQTDPASGACLGPLSPTVTTGVSAGATPTFGVFITGTGDVPFDPANNRVVVTFADDGGVTRGSTSVAIRTN